MVHAAAATSILHAASFFLLLLIISIVEAQKCADPDLVRGEPCSDDGFTCELDTYGDSNIPDCDAICANGEWLIYCPFVSDPNCPEKEPALSQDQCGAELEGVSCSEEVWGGDKFCARTCQNGQWNQLCIVPPPEPAIPTLKPAMGPNLDCSDPEFALGKPCSVDGFTCTLDTYGDANIPDCDAICANGEWLIYCPFVSDPNCPEREPEAWSQCGAELEGIECSEAVWGGGRFCAKTCESGQWAHICLGEPPLPDEPTLEPIQGPIPEPTAEPTAPTSSGDATISKCYFYIPFMIIAFLL